ncbi:restriction endonuclease subunit S [Acinetobacter modestus]|nr:restriction endonuclease subunit S [Acinetobacter modestus]MCH7329008.1 restriction endonuclease subunit S [Acinetobacter modestus]
MATPKLRFKEFGGDWTSNKLKQLTDVLKCGVASTPTYVDEGGYPFLSAQNVSRDGLMDYSKVNNISAEFYKKISKTKLLKGDILYSRVGASYGVASIFDKDEEYGVYVSLTHIRANKDLDNVFLKLFLNSPKARLQAERGVFQGGGVQNLNVGVVEEFELSIPSKPEQTKIAIFLSVVDTKIQQLTQKHALLCQYKQGMMQQLFSQQIRFKTDDGGKFGEWELSKLANYINEFKNTSKVQDEYEVLTSSRKGLVRQAEYFEGSRLVDRENIGYNIIQPNQITYRSRSDDGLFFFNLNKLGITGIISTYYPVFNMKNSDNRFFCEYLNFYKKEYVKYAVGTSQLVLSLNELRNMKFKIPCLEEQTKIANFLSAIDQKIEVVAQQIDQAKQWKKGLLQQMFV